MHQRQLSHRLKVFGEKDQRQILGINLFSLKSRRLGPLEVTKGEKKIKTKPHGCLWVFSRALISPAFARNVPRLSRQASPPGVHLILHLHVYYIYSLRVLSTRVFPMGVGFPTQIDIKKTDENSAWRAEGEA